MTIEEVPASHRCFPHKNPREMSRREAPDPQGRFPRGSPALSSTHVADLWMASAAGLPVTQLQYLPARGRYFMGHHECFSNHEIEGYGASASSVNRGDSIRLFVNTTNPSYTLEVFRMGWYGGAGARMVTSPATLAGKRQPSPFFDPNTRLVKCQSPYVLTVPDNPKDPTDWASGVYLVKLTAPLAGSRATSFSSCETTRGIWTCSLTAV